MPHKHKSAGSHNQLWECITYISCMYIMYNLHKQADYFYVKWKFRSNFQDWITPNNLLNLKTNFFSLPAGLTAVFDNSIGYLVSDTWPPLTPLSIQDSRDDSYEQLGDICDKYCQYWRLGTAKYGNQSIPNNRIGQQHTNLEMFAIGCLSDFCPSAFTCVFCVCVKLLIVVVSNCVFCVRLIIRFGFSVLIFTCWSDFDAQSLLCW